MEKIYKDGEVLEATDLNNSFAELEAKLNALAVEKIPTPELSDGIVPDDRIGFEIYKFGNLIIFQGSLKVTKPVPSNNFFKTPLPAQYRPKQELWFPCVLYHWSRNLILTPDGHLRTSNENGSRKIETNWYEVGAVKYIITPSH